MRKYIWYLIKQSSPQDLYKITLVTGGMFGNRVAGHGEDKTEILDYTKTNKWYQSKFYPNFK